MGAKQSAENETLKIDIGGDERMQQMRHRKPFNCIKTTKYTWITFLPLNLLGQFRRLAYFYFLVVTIISFFVNSTISPFTSLVPLLFVIVVSWIKQGREEILRYRTDKVVNRTLVTVLRNGKKTYVAAQYIAPGELVIVERDCDVPCDLLLLQTSDPYGKCFVTTANLDGETNLKTLLIPRDIPQVATTELTQLGVIECEQSKIDLYDFNGKIHLSAGGTIPLSAENLLLSGAHIKNTEFVIGCAVYTGMTTKLQLNSRLSSNKSASSDGYINRFLLFLVAVMVIFVTILYFFERQDELFTVPLKSYLGPPVNVNKITEILEDYLSFLVIVNYMVPVSMYMNIELYRVFGALFLMWDRQLYDEDTDQPCVVNTSNLIEELGQINILFSDKTGTLTKNEMVFQQCSIHGEKFLFEGNHLKNVETCADLTLRDFDDSQQVFFQALAICHTVQVVGTARTSTEVDNAAPALNGDLLFQVQSEENLKRKIQAPRSYQSGNIELVAVGGETVPLKTSRSASIVSRESYAEPIYHLNQANRRQYQALSSDEKALVEACAELGLVFLGNDSEVLRLHMKTNPKAPPNELSFKRLHILEFTADRKRMSVIVEDSKGTKWIYAKGAENSIFPLCEKKAADMVLKTDQQITEFAKHGLRTLAIARRQIDDLEYEDFLDELTAANNSLEMRKQLSERCYAKVERDLQLIGATAVEDMLQDDVAETLESIQKAGLKIWVLTGDKVETALNIALACSHIPAEAIHHMILGCTKGDEVLQKLFPLECDLSAGRLSALLIDGQSLSIALSEIPNEFCQLAINCRAVLCCRLSPLQKSQVIALIKKFRSNLITAAVGDGANDVSMIQEAHVGIGIMGKEGRQAARSADFAISKFSMLKRLLLVHGHNNTVRLSFLVLFYCYKNVVFTGNMFIYQFHTLFSSTSVYHSLFLWLYDAIYISGGMTCVTLFERPCSEETLLSKPELYKKNAHNHQARWSLFLTWMLNGLYQTLIIYFFSYYFLTNNDILWNNGQTADFYCFGTIMVQIVIFVENLKLLLAAKHLNYWLIGFVIASMLVFVISTVIYNVIDTGSDLYWLYNSLLGSIPTWLFTILTTIACLLPDYTYAVGRNLIDWKFLQITSRKAV